jgi:hypothetical protein
MQAGTASAEPRSPLPPWPEETLRIWQFDEPLRAYETNQTGGALIVDSSVWVESWSGYALNRQGVSVKPIAMVGRIREPGIRGYLPE